MREGPPIQSCITPNPNCSQPQAKSSFWKILAISAYRSRFCAGTRQYLPGNSFVMNILDRCPKSVEENDPSLEGKSLFQNILRVSPCGSIFCPDSFGSRLSKSFRINILVILTKKMWRDCYQAKSLFCNILAVSPWGSRFCEDPAGSIPGKSLRMNILEKWKEKKWRRPSPNIPLPIPPNHPPDKEHGGRAHMSSRQDRSTANEPSRRKTT